MTETETETEGRLFLLRLPQGKEKGVEGGRRGGDVECGMWNVERRCKGGAEAKKRVERVRESRVEDRAWMVICSLFAPLLPLSSSLSLSPMLMLVSIAN
jgi:hypothetical protein